MAGMFVPQMVAPVDTSGLAALGEKIGTWRQEAGIADVLKGLDPADPHSRARTLSDLRARGDRASRDMADRLEGSWNTQAFQQGQLGVAQERNKLAREQFQYGKETTAEDRRAEAERRRLVATGLSQQPAPVAAPPPREEPRLPATEDWPDEDQPAAAAPAPQRASAAPQQGIFGPSAAARPDPRGTPQEQAANAQRIIQGQRPVPPASVAAAPAPFADRFAASAEGGLASLPSPAPGQGGLPPPPPRNIAGTGGLPTAPAPLAASPIPGAQYGAAPVTPEPQMASAGGRPAPARPPASAGPVIAPAAGRTSTGMTEEQITSRLNYLENLKASANPQETRAIDGQIKRHEAALKEITDVRDTERAVALERKKEATKLDLKSRDELGKAYSAKLDTINAVKPDLNRAQWIINQPNFRGGPGAKPIEYAYGLGQALNNIARTVLPEGWTPVSREAMDKWTGGDEKAFMEEARAIMKGFAAHSANLLKGPTSDKDLRFSEAQNANLDMSVTGVNRMINRIKAEHARIERNHKVVFDGIDRDKTHAQIEGNLRRVGQIPLFVDKDGNPTELGRAVDVTQGRPGAGAAVAAPTPVDKTPAARGGPARVPTSADEGATVYKGGQTYIIRNGVPVLQGQRAPAGGT